MIERGIKGRAPGGGRALGRRTPGEAYRAKGKALPDSELAARTQAKLDEEQAAKPQPSLSKTSRRKPVLKDARTELTCADVTVGPKTHKIDRHGCIAQNGIAGMRRILNLGRCVAGRIAELLIDHGQAIVTDLETGEILTDQTLGTTCEYQYCVLTDSVNDAPRRCKACPRRCVNHAPRHHKSTS